MGLGVGIFLIAVGAILAFAVNATSGAGRRSHRGLDPDGCRARERLAGA